MELKPNEKLDIENILKDLDKYRPKRRGWTWRKGSGEKRKIGKFTYYDTAESLKTANPYQQLNTSTILTRSLNQ